LQLLKKPLINSQKSLRILDLLENIVGYVFAYNYVRLLSSKSSYYAQILELFNKEFNTRFLFNKKVSYKYFTFAAKTK